MKSVTNNIPNPTIDGITVRSNILWTTVDFGTNGVGYRVYRCNTNGAAISYFAGVTSIEHLAFDTNGTIWIASDNLFHQNVPVGNRLFNFTDAGTPVFQTSFTLAAWVFPTNIASATQIVLENRGITSGRSAFRMFTTTAGAVSAGGSMDASTASSVLTNNGWQHIAATYDRTNIAIFVNGMLSTNVVATLTNWDTSHTTIGGRTDGTVGFRGLIDDVRIYNTALATNEITALASPP